LLPDFHNCLIAEIYLLPD